MTSASGGKRGRCAGAVTTVVAAAALFAAQGAAATAGGASLERRLANAERRLDTLDDHLPDDAKALGEFTLFDECAYLVGVSVRHDLWFGDHGGASALSLDLTGATLPDHDVLAFPAEEPPGIECNEDAEPEDTDSG